MASYLCRVHGSKPQNKPLAFLKRFMNQKTLQACHIVPKKNLYSVQGSTTQSREPWMNQSRSYENLQTQVDLLLNDDSDATLCGIAKSGSGLKLGVEDLDDSRFDLQAIRHELRT